jgi:hypothetical protein
MDLPTEQQRQEIEAELFADRKISAIKLYRKATGTGLAEAKHAVEDMEVDLRRRSPESFIGGSRKAGCFSVVICAALIITIVAFVSLHLLTV